MPGTHKKFKKFGLDSFVGPGDHRGCAHKTVGEKRLSMLAELDAGQNINSIPDESFALQPPLNIGSIIAEDSQPLWPWGVDGKAGTSHRRFNNTGIRKDISIVGKCKKDGCDPFCKPSEACLHPHFRLGRHHFVF